MRPENNGFSDFGHQNVSICRTEQIEHPNKELERATETKARHLAHSKHN